MADDLRARAAADRLRTYVELLPNAYALGEIAYDERFRSSEWPRTAYHPNRDDLLAVLAELDRIGTENTVLHQALREHESCSTCGHERHQHERDPVLRAMWCRACTTLDDLHDFPRTTEETAS